MKKRLYSFFVIMLSTALILVGYWGYTQYKEKNALLVIQEGMYQRSLYDLAGSITSLENILAKVMVAGTREFERSQLFIAWQQAYQAQKDLAQIPVTGEPFINTQKFLNQLSDYCHVLANGESQNVMEITDRQQINMLYNQAWEIRILIHNLFLDVNKENFLWSNNILNSKREKSGTRRNLSDELFTGLEKQLQNIPQLIYDGPFSDALVNKKVTLKGNDIQKNEAIKIAKKFLGRKDRDDSTSYNILENNNQTLPVYSLKVIPDYGSIGDQIVMDITKIGGHVVWMLNNRSVGEVVLTLEEAQKKAERFLLEKGFDNFIATGVLRTYNQAVVSFAEVQDNLLIYPHLIKVKVALDNGEITGFDALSYLVNSQERKWPENALSEQVARDILMQEIQIEDINQVIIPLDNGKDAICWEFKGTIENNTYLIYIDAVSGKELNILRYMETEDGIITI